MLFFRPFLFFYFFFIFFADLPFIIFEKVLLLLFCFLGEVGQDINAWKTQRRDHTAISCYNKLNIEERKSEQSDERDGNENGGQNDQSCQCWFGNRPSTEASAGSTTQRGWPARDRNLRRHITADLVRAKPRRHRSHPQNSSSVFSLSLSARRFKKHVAAGPAPPDVDQMSGQKVDLSTSRIRSSYLARFWRSWRR